MTKEQQYWENTQEALSRVFDRCEEIDTQSGYILLEDIKFVRGFINKHKPKEGGDKEWVSVLDRPPSKDGRYFVTRHDYVTQTDFTDILWYEKGVWWNRQAAGDYAVTAWQVLPRPYKAEGEVENLAGVAHSEKHGDALEVGCGKHNGLKGKIANLRYPSDLSISEFVRQNYDKCVIMAIGSCNIPSEEGDYTSVLLFKGRSKVLTEYRIVTNSANKCMLMGIRDATLAIKSPVDVIILTSTPLGFNSPNSVNSGLCQEICRNLEEKGCSITITSCKGKGRELRDFISFLSDASTG